MYPACGVRCSAAMAETLLGRASSRRDELCAFAGRASRTARLRAVPRRARRPLVRAAVRIALPPSGTTCTRNGRRRSNWRVPRRSTPLYADLPVGVHPEGFDPLWAPHVFVAGVHGGAPPDLFFDGGQDWSFPPLHPERMREDGYRYFIEIVRRACAPRLVPACRSRDGPAASVLDPRGIRRPPRCVRVVSGR